MFTFGWLSSLFSKVFGRYFIVSHGGVVVFLARYVLKFSFHQKADYLKLNYLFAYKYFDDSLLPQSKVIFSCSFLSVFLENKYVGFTHDATVNELYSGYYKLISESLCMVNSVDESSYIKSYADVLSDDYTSLIHRSLESIVTNQSTIYISNIHGDLWAENIVVTSDRDVNFIDLDRFSVYSFPELDLINFYVYQCMSLKGGRSWDVFGEIIKELRVEDVQDEGGVSGFIEGFYKYNKLKYDELNTVVINNLLDLYLLKVILDNDFYLNLILKHFWLRHRSSVEELLWN
jgi:hypothetical protein